MSTPPEISTVDLAANPPRVTFPRRYNASFDFVDRHITEGRGDRIAFVDDRESVSYAEFATRVRRAASALRTLGIDTEQRVALCLHDTIDFPVAFWGAIRAGIVPVPLNTLLAAKDYVHPVIDSRARALIVSDALLPRLSEAIDASPWLRHVVVVPSPLGDSETHGRTSWRSLLDAAHNGDDSIAETTSDDVAFWLYSSGSTGSPKGATHLHSHLMWTAALYARAVLGIGPDDVVYSAAKLFFAYGLGNAMTFPLAVGATAVLRADRPTPALVLRTLREQRVTIFGGVPTLFASILAQSTRDECAEIALRASTSAGEALPRHIGEQWHERFGSHILDGIGSTEMLHIFISNRHGDVRYGTSGKPVAGYDVKLVNDDGAPVADGEEGSLWVSGPSSATSYWNQRARSLATFEGRWTRTGDRYIRDAEGYFTYSGRADDMLKVGGIWVAPFEVESAVTSHPAVLEAAVVGHADAEGLVKPKAFVVLKPSIVATTSLADELKIHVKARLAPYKYPRWIEFVDELPKTATGKIQRFRLRAP